MSLFLMFGKSGYFTCTNCKKTWDIKEGELEVAENEYPCATCYEWVAYLTEER